MLILKGNRYILLYKENDCSKRKQILSFKRRPLFLECLGVLNGKQEVAIVENGGKSTRCIYSP